MVEGEFMFEVNKAKTNASYLTLIKSGIVKVIWSGSWKWKK